MNMKLSLTEAARQHQEGLDNKGLGPSFNQGVLDALQLVDQYDSIHPEEFCIPMQSMAGSASAAPQSCIAPRDVGFGLKVVSEFTYL